MREYYQIGNIVNINLKEVRQIKFMENSRPSFQNKLYKIIYFFWREGISQTVSKYIAHKEYQNQVEYLTFLTVQEDGNDIINISVQSTQSKDDFIIENKFFEARDIDFDWVEKRVEKLAFALNQFSEPDKYEILKLGNSKTISLETKPADVREEFDKGLFIFGLGGYSQIYIIKHFKTTPKLACVDYKADLAERFKSRFKFNYKYLVPEDTFPLLENTKLPIVVIATYHSDHAKIAFKTFNNNRNSIIFIEKPPIVTLEDLSLLISLYNQSANIEIGFNRRFTSFSKYVKNKIKKGPVVVNCSIKEVLINETHWYFWKNQGTRITGNAVHWIDLGNWWINSDPLEINLLGEPNDQNAVVISILYEDGSILNLNISDFGNSLRGVQEKLEVRFGDETIFIDDFLKLTHIKNNGKRIIKRRRFRDKGHHAMYRNFNKITQNLVHSQFTVRDLIKDSVITYFASFMLQNNIRNLKITNELNSFYSMATKQPVK